MHVCISRVYRVVAVAHIYTAGMVHCQVSKRTIISNFVKEYIPKILQLHAYKYIYMHVPKTVTHHNIVETCQSFSKATKYNHQKIK